jgi:hypothetical protein
MGVPHLAVVAAGVQRAPNVIVGAALTVTVNGVQFFQLAFQPNYPSDCGHAARKVMAEAQGQPLQLAAPAPPAAPAMQVVNPVQARLGPISMPFGDPRTLPSPVGAGQVAKQTHLMNKYAAPGIGEAYVTATTALAPGVWNFHWGAVIARSGTDVITLEGFQNGMAAWNQTWSLQMYSQDAVNHAAQTFHRVQKHSGHHGGLLQPAPANPDKPYAWDQPGVAYAPGHPWAYAHKPFTAVATLAPPPPPPPVPMVIG